MRPYILISILFIFLAILGALDAALVQFDLLPWFNGLRWVRVHLITLGALTEAVFGILPILVAGFYNLKRPAMRWDIWLALNAGLLTLLVGIPIINYVLIVGGGTLIFLATMMLMKQLRDLGKTAPIGKSATGGKVFYISGLSFLLLGILVGSGLWFGWGEALHIAVPIEVHIHANNWGFMSLIFAGLLIDLYPKISGRSLARPGSLRWIFWGLTLGALALVIGPWLQNNVFSVIGIVLHLSATFTLLANVISPLRGDPRLKSPGMLHILTAYTWQIMPVLVAPLIIINVPGFPGAGIEQTAPQALIYGWVLQFGFAILPFLVRQAFHNGKPAQLGGSWFSLITVNLGAVALWVSIFSPADMQKFLLGVAYGMWTFALIPILGQIWTAIRQGGDSEVEQEFFNESASRKSTLQHETGD